VGQTLDDHMVKQIVAGDPTSIIGLDDAVLLQVGIGSVARFVR
jgi:hypothetical protein